MRASSGGMSAERAARMSMASGGERRSTLHLVAPRALGGVLGGVGVCDEMLTPHPERIARGHADAAGEVDGRTEPLDLHLRHSAADAFGDRVCRSGVGAAKDHHEFLSTIAADHIRVTQL